MCRCECVFQGAALKYFPATFVDLMQVFDVKELRFVGAGIEYFPGLQNFTVTALECQRNVGFFLSKA